MTAPKTISKNNERGISIRQMLAEIADAPDLQGVVDPYDLQAPSGEVERPEDERMMRRIGLALLNARLTEDVAEGDIGTVKRALDEAGIPLAMYEAAVQNERFQAILDDLNRAYVLVPRATSVMLAVTKRAASGEAAAVNIFLRELHSQDQNALDQARKILAQGGKEAVSQLVETIMARASQISRDIENATNAEDERRAAIAAITKIEDAADSAGKVDHSALHLKTPLDSTDED